MFLAIFFLEDFFSLKKKKTFSLKKKTRFKCLYSKAQKEIEEKEVREREREKLDENYSCQERKSFSTVICCKLQ